MFAWSNNVLREEGGHAALEFAFLIPMLLLILAVVLDLGRALYSETAIEKGLRSAAIFAAQSAYPLTPATRNAATNLPKTGDPRDRKSVGSGKSVAVRVNTGGRRINNKKK